MFCSFLALTITSIVLKHRDIMCAFVISRMLELDRTFYMQKGAVGVFIKTPPQITTSKNIKEFQDKEVCISCNRFILVAKVLPGVAPSRSKGSCHKLNKQ